MIMPAPVGKPQRRVERLGIAHHRQRIEANLLVAEGEGVIERSQGNQRNRRLTRGGGEATNRDTFSCTGNDPV